MRSNQLTTPIVKLSILCVIAWLIWRMSQTTAHGLTKFDLEELAEQTVPEVPVHVGAVSQKTMHDYLTVFGTVEPAPGTDGSPPAGASITVASRSEVTGVSCVEGQHVTSGETLFTLFGGATVVSPLAGTVIAMQIRPGEIARPTVTAVEVVDLNRLVIAVDVPAFDLPRIQIGQGAVVNPGYSTTATPPTSRPDAGSQVIRIDHQINPTTGMGSTDISVPTGSNLLPGQWVQVKIAVEDRADALTVPADSIVHDSQGRPSVAALIRSGRWAELQPVELGLREGNSVEIRGSQLRAGQSIVTGGAYALPDSSAIRVLKD
jgi:multidrug efflux pump subunit AcrA (membrane-fusion protein)